MSDLSDNIESNAQGPKQMQVDGNSATQHSIDDQIKAHQFLKERANVGKKKLPLRFGKLRPDGAL